MTTKAYLKRHEDNSIKYFTRGEKQLYDSMTEVQRRHYWKSHWIFNAEMESFDAVTSVMPARHQSKDSRPKEAIYVEKLLWQANDLIEIAAAIHDKSRDYPDLLHDPDAKPTVKPSKAKGSRRMI